MENLHNLNAVDETQMECNWWINGQRHATTAAILITQRAVSRNRINICNDAYVFIINKREHYLRFQNYIPNVRA